MGSTLGQILRISSYERKILLAACTASYFVSYFLMENTIMTEKIARRGVRTPHAYQPDTLEKVAVKRVLQDNSTVISCDATIEEAQEWLLNNKDQQQN
ncbi:MAG: hypothetical protein INR73_17680 [Williamsia sp.]|nr:hypothetical protein [Williamsia sp.]